MVKIFFDYFVSLALIFILSPLFITISLLVLILLGRPILFKQTRVGFKKKPFIIYKYRTMHIKKNDKGELLDDSLRISKFGLFLRSTSMDEIPALLNVLKGEMSLVGPRPLLLEYLPLYNLQQIKRHNVKPGITGWAQINGRNRISWGEKFELDIWYVKNRTFMLDLKIMFKTLQKILLREAVTQKGSVSSSKFNGKN